jgi:hypothetical protein
MKILPFAAALALLAPATADAATISVFGGPSGPEVRYAAAPGETNHLNVAYAGDARSVTVTDPGATIVAGDGCVSAGDHTATCRPLDGGYLQHAVADLGDGGDSVTTSRPPGPPIGGVEADGGAGDDLLDGGAGPDTLDGGEGSDTVLGGDGSDTVHDGDTEEDTLEGGAGEFDTVDYSGRTDDLAIMLRESTFENAIAGSGNDSLAGSGGPNRLSGGPGNDTLVGFGDADDLDGGSGKDILLGSHGGDRLRGGAGPDSLICGVDADLVIGPQAGELLLHKCERMMFAFGEEKLDQMGWRTMPRRGRQELTCPTRETLDGETARCSGTYTLRLKGGRRIARVHFSRDLGDGPFTVKVPMLRGRPITATVRGKGLPTRSWTYRLPT